MAESAKASLIENLLLIIPFSDAIHSLAKKTNEEWELFLNELDENRLRTLLLLLEEEQDSYQAIEAKRERALSKLGYA